MVNACVELDFFDALEELSSESDSASDDSDDSTSELQQVDDNEFNSSHYDFWSGNPKSIDERREDFIRMTGFVLDRCQTAREGPDDTSCVITRMSNDRTAEANEHDEGDNLSDQNREAVNDEDQDVLSRIQCLDSEEANNERMPRKRNDTYEFQETFGSSNLVQRFMTRESAGSDMARKRKEQCKEGWLKRFSFKAANMFSKDKENKEVFHNSSKLFGSRSPRVRVRSHKKWSKELSSLYHKQEFSAHKGSILSMKFSLDGQYLATGGEDGILNVWKIVEEERMTDFDLLSFSVLAAGLNVSVNGIPKLACLLKFKEEGNVMNKLKKSSDSAGNGIMVPRKVFRILEKPWNEFHGHEGEIPDISWSKNGRLLSSSVDKTVRLWKVGCSQCLRVFPHNDFVTCAQFNPMDDNYFISGSIDGKVRVWDVRRCQVLDWIDIKEIVTAICYRPDGKGGIVGSMAGNCSFFDIADDFFHRPSVIYLRDKKMLTCKRITCFQFSPSNPSEVVVSSTDSLVRILKGADIVCKLRGSVPLIDRGSQVFASFTADGKHIVSATDDSNVYIWNYLNNERTTNSRPKNIWSSESFLSSNALIALPWNGITSTSTLPSPKTRQPSTLRHNQGSSVPSDDCHSVNHDVMSSTIVSPAIGDIDYEFLRNVCESILSGSHMWGLVIVTGGKDGHIRTYHNYGLPVRYPTGKSLKSSFSLSNFRNRCKEHCNSLGGSTSFSR